MPPVNRNKPRRAPSSDSTYTLMDLQREFPDDATALDHLWRSRFSPDGETAECPKCKQTRRYYRAESRPSYCCSVCGHHLHPTAGTIFHKSSTGLHLWFHAIFLVSSTRCGVSAKELERQLGVTYKTAWRMLNLIRRQLMSEDGDGPMDGTVEMDETYMGGRRRNTPPGRPSAESHKTPIFGMVERQRGRISATVMPNVQHKTIRPYIEKRVLPSAMVYTDEYQIYDPLSKGGYRHRRVHHAAKVYVDGDVHTNTIEGFFSLLKNGIRGTHHAVSRKWLQGYLDEFAWRYNHRGDPMFKPLLAAAASRPRPAAR
jgi:transposase